MTIQGDQPIDADDDLRRRVDTIKQEVDELQIETARGRRAWYRNHEVVVPLGVSLAALLFTIWSSAQSEARILRQDQHAARAELRGLIQRLQALPKENYDLRVDYQADPATLSLLSGQINAETLVLGQQAADLIEQLEGKVSASEFSAAAFALSQVGQSAQADELLTQGLSVANDAYTKGILLRQIGGARFAVGDLAGGRDFYGQAARIFEDFPESNPYQVSFITAFTEGSWATAELGQRQCPEAWAHIQIAEQHAAMLAETDIVRLQTQATKASIAQTCPPPQ